MANTFTWWTIAKVTSSFPSVELELLGTDSDKDTVLVFGAIGQFAASLK